MPLEQGNGIVYLQKAVTRYPMLPSAYLDASAPPKEGLFAAQYLAHISPVNASQPTLRASAHDSGPMRFATPSSYGTFTHYLSPVLTGAPRPDPHNPLYAGNPHVRFDEGKLVKAATARLLGHRQTKEAETDKPNLRLQWPASYSTVKVFDSGFHGG